MDDIVKQAMLKWPNVPHCYGWLGLDARGNWYMRDDRAQSLGSFASGIPGAKGSLLQHAKLIEFIQRNYASDAQGQWFFQNGPQRVYVELEATPWVWRVASDFHMTAHDGTGVDWQQCYTDERGWLYCQTSLGFGLVHTQDVTTAADAIEQGLWNVQNILRSELPGRFGFAISPQGMQATKKPVQ
ncbi:DUF2946 domain-containing protein [Rhodoferax lacus]|uniref:DUF2946 domain-containing protein n=1 Tax=Rhodoferax lacus TaxID=2184758 RepID=A0A3E1R6X1_9BURK|nr:DUF2946 family protein [Rhodoferax lacus]RFO94792.1 DUF2946 domain-containing protein [Rhodoferax lacus]